MADGQGSLAQKPASGDYPKVFAVSSANRKLPTNLVGTCETAFLNADEVKTLSLYHPVCDRIVPVIRRAISERLW